LSFDRTSLNVKIKSQRSRSSWTKKALYTHNTPTVSTESNAIVVDNVTQAAGAAIRSLQRGVFAGMRALGLAGYRWALTRISSFQIKSSLKITPQLKGVATLPREITWHPGPVFCTTLPCVSSVVDDATPREATLHRRSRSSNDTMQQEHKTSN